MSVLTIEQVRKQLGGRDVLRGIDLHIAEGDPVYLRHVHGVPDRAVGADRNCSDPADLPSAVRLQRDPGADRLVGHPDAQHADPDRTDQGQSGGGARSVPFGGRGDRAACPSGYPDGPGGGAGLHPADGIGVLGIAGLYADRRHGGRNRADPDVPASALCDLVSHKADERA